MTGFTSKRQMAQDKLVETQEELGMYDDQKPPMTKDEALNMALQALEIHTVWFSRDTMIGKSMHEKGNKAITAIKEALAQPEQVPVAWMTPDGEGFRIRFLPPVNKVPLGWDALYTTPQKRPWVGLTDEEISATSKGHMVRSTYARAIESKLKEKNGL